MCFKGRKYFKDLCRSEMTANSQWVKFSALAMFSLYIRDMLMGQELVGKLPRQLACVLHFWLLFYEDKADVLYIAWNEIMSLKQPERS